MARGWPSRQTSRGPRPGREGGGAGWGDGGEGVSKVRCILHWMEKHQTATQIIVAALTSFVTSAIMLAKG